MLERLRKRLTQRDDDGLTLIKAVLQGALLAAIAILLAAAALEILRRAAE